MSVKAEDECSSHASNNLAKKPWTREEIEDLYYMSFHDHTMTEMVRELQRPRKKVVKALRKIQAQQALFHPLDEVATAHNIDTDRLKKYLRDPLYYVPLPEQGVPSLLITGVVIFGLVFTYGYAFF